MFTPFAFRTIKAEEIIPSPSYVTSGLVRFYDAENAGGTPTTTWTDIQANQNGTVGANVTWTTGTPNYYDFLGSGTTAASAVDFSPNPFTGTQNHTICVWFNADSTGDGVLSYVGRTGFPTYQFQKITMRTISNQLRLEFEGAGQNTSLTYSTGTWYQAAYKLDGTRPNDCTIYLNNSKQAITASTTTLNLSSLYMYTGVQTGFHPFNGKVAVYMAYNRALSDAEIEQNFDYFKTRYGY